MATDDLIDLYCKYMRRKSRSPRTINDRSRILRHADRELPFGLDAALEPEIEDWLWRGHLAPRSRATYYTTFVSFYRWAVDHAGVITRDPTIRIDRPQAPRGAPRVARDDYVRFIVTQAAEPYRLWGKLAAYCGLRCIEIHRLHREHITPDRLHVVRGKGNKSRWVPTHSIIWDAVRDLPGGPVTETADERQLSNSFLVYCKRRGMENMSLHRMRGWFATRSYRATKDILAVQLNMGHEDPGVTAGYIEVDDSQIRAVIDGLPVFGLSGAAVAADAATADRGPVH